MMTDLQPVEILLVEDNPADARLAQEALKESKLINTLVVVSTGEEALDYLYKRGPYIAAGRPGLILLDLNLPGIRGRDVLNTIKQDEELKAIPVLILTSSKAEEDILKSYQLHANCFITKPVNGKDFIQLVHILEQFWFQMVQLPK